MCERHTWTSSTKISNDSALNSKHVKKLPKGKQKRKNFKREPRGSDIVTKPKNKEGNSTTDMNEIRKIMKYNRKYQKKEKIDILLETPFIKPKHNCRNEIAIGKRRILTSQNGTWTRYSAT